MSEIKFSDGMPVRERRSDTDFIQKNCWIKNAVVV